MRTQSYDCLIVGGGPAGSTCAWKLRQAGADVLVLDKASFPRDKTCAGWITPSVVESLELDVADYCRSRTWQPIEGFRCGLIDGGSVDVDYSAPVSFGIRRREFDDYLLRRAGVDTIQHHVSAIERTGDVWRIDDTYSAPMLVGAGGNFCPVARLLGVSHASPETTVVAQEVEFPLTASQLEHLAVAAVRPELYFCKDMKGYGWCFRKHDFLNVGLGRTDPSDLSQHVAAFCDFLRVSGRVPSKLPARFRGHAYRLYDRTTEIPTADGALLIGDAAGLAYPQSGEGIGPAIESGRLAANAILHSKGDYRREQLSTYVQLLRLRLGTAQSGSGVISWLPASWVTFAAAKLLTTRWFAKRVVMDQLFLR